MESLTNASVPSAVLRQSGEEKQCVIGEIACVIADVAVAAREAAALLTGDLEAPVHSWAERNLALAWQGSSEVEISEDVLVLVEGRLDNRRELLDRAHERPSASDARLVAALWRRYGESMVDLIVGELAAVVVVGRALACSPSGTCAPGGPLHVARVGEKHAVASEWRPLAFAGGVAPSPNPEWFASCFLWQTIAPRATPYVGVEMVLPGYVATPSSAGGSRYAVPNGTSRGFGTHETARTRTSSARCSTRPCAAGFDRPGPRSPCVCPGGSIRRA